MIADDNSVAEIDVGFVSTGAKASSFSDALQKLEKLLTTCVVGRLLQQDLGPDVLLSSSPVAHPIPPTG